MVARRYRVYQVDTFASERFTGNPAGVVVDAAGLSASQMQAIAREFNNSETAFILPPTAADHDVTLRYFTPKVEVPLCGHATIAAHYVLAQLGRTGPGNVAQRSPAGISRIRITHERGDYHVAMLQGTPTFGDPWNSDDIEELRKALGLSRGEMMKDCPVQVASTGHSKVIVGVGRRSVLDALHPDLGALTNLSRRIKCNGYFLFTLDSPSEQFLTWCRMFAPAIGIDEDPVTGNGNGPLGAYLVAHGLANLVDGKLTFHSRQGVAMGRPGTARVSITVRDGTAFEVSVAGDAVITFTGEVLV